jgi:hypothetical protein
VRKFLLLLMTVLLSGSARGGETAPATETLATPSVAASSVEDAQSAAASALAQELRKAYVEPITKYVDPDRAAWIMKCDAKSGEPHFNPLVKGGEPCVVLYFKGWGTTPEFESAMRRYHAKKVKPKKGWYGVFARVKVNGIWLNIELDPPRPHPAGGTVHN